MSSDSDSETDSETSPPVALNLGEIVLARPEWEALASVGGLLVGTIQTNPIPFSFLTSVSSSYNTILFAHSISLHPRI